MDITLTNIGNATGTYDSDLIDIASAPLNTTIVNGLSITKTADQSVWVTGPLTYTITITNDAANDFENPTITDTLDPTLITLVANSVQYNGSPVTYTYDPITGLLTVVIDTIPTTETGVLTFQVLQI